MASAEEVLDEAPLFILLTSFFTTVRTKTTKATMATMATMAKPTKPVRSGAVRVRPLSECVGC